MTEVSWLDAADPRDVSVVLSNYRFFVHRFPQWIALAISRSEQEAIRGLLLPNLLEECGANPLRATHLELLDRCLTSCGLDPARLSDVTEESRDAEMWFYSVFDREEPAAALSVLGPGTEAEAWSFLGPLEAAVRRTFPGPSTDLTYFRVHHPGVEKEHIEAIEQCLALLAAAAEEEARGVLRARSNEWATRARARHQRFWTDLETTLEKPSWREVHSVSS